MTARDRRARRVARRADADGSGPSPTERPAARFPGATGAFALFGEVLTVGVMVAAAGIAIVTAPAALAAGARHLRRYLAAEASPQRAFWRDVRDALPGGLLVGTGALVVVLVLVLNVHLAGTGALPGGGVVNVIAWAGLVIVPTAVLSTAAAWTPEGRWRAALAGLPGRVAADPPGALYLVAAVVFTGVVTWALVPLILPALGCALLAAVAAPARPRRRRAADA